MVDPGPRRCTMGLSNFQVNVTTHIIYSKTEKMQDCYGRLLWAGRGESVGIKVISLSGGSAKKKLFGEVAENMNQKNVSFLYPCRHR